MTARTDEEFCGTCGRTIRRETHRWKYIDGYRFPRRIYYCDDYCLPNWAGGKEL